MTRRTLVTTMTAFTATLLLFELAVRLVAGQLPTPQPWRDVTIAAKADQLATLGCVDVIVAGNSQALDGLSPATLSATLGTQTYNAAFDAATPTTTRDWLTHHVIPQLEVAPSLALIAVASFDVNADAAETLEADISWEQAAATRTDPLGQLQRAAGRHLATVNHRVELRDPQAWIDGPRRDVRRARQVTIRDDGQGTARSDDIFEDTETARRYLQNQLLGIHSVDQRQLEELETLIGELHETGTETVIVVMPVTDTYLETHPGGPDGHDAVIDEVRRHVETAGATLLDQSRWAAGRPELFADTHHLNGRGASQLSDALGRELADSHPRSGCTS